MSHSDEAKIYQALYPRWNYTGGWIIAEVDGNTVTLQGYADPDQQESEILIRKIKDNLSWEPKIYWKRIGSTSQPVLFPLLLPDTKQKKVAVSSVKSSEPVKKEQAIDMPKTVEQVCKEAEAKAVLDISAVVRFAESTKSAIENKAAQDIQLLGSFAESSKTQATQNIQRVKRSLEETKRQACQLLDQATQGAGQVVALIQQTIIESWNKDWVNILIDIISRSADLDKAKDEVKELQKDYPHEQPIQIADRIIRKKTLYATATGLISGIVPGVALVVDLVSTTPLLVEMVYQIAAIYGFDNLKDPVRKGELLAIFGMALGSHQIVQLGLGFLAKNTPIPSWAIDASTNVIMFQLVGYAASQFYETKVQSSINPLTSIEASTVLEKKVEAYLQKAISQKEAVREVVDDAVLIKELAYS